MTCKIFLNIQKTSSQLELLDLSGWKISDDGLAAISLCIHNIKKLRIGNAIGGTNITIVGINTLAKSLRQMPHPVIDTLSLTRFCYEFLVNFHGRNRWTRNKIDS